VADEIRKLAENSKESEKIKNQSNELENV